MRVAPFGHLRIMAHLQLPAAFRSLSRPSSAPGAKASALRPNSLDHSRSCISGSLLFSLELTVFPVVRPSLRPVLRSFPDVFDSLPYERITPRLMSFLFFVCISSSRDLFCPRSPSPPPLTLRPARVSARPCPVRLDTFLQDYRICGFQGAYPAGPGTMPSLHRTSFFFLAATCSPAPSPVKYHRPRGS